MIRCKNEKVLGQICRTRSHSVTERIKEGLSKVVGNVDNFFEKVMKSCLNNVDNLVQLFRKVFVHNTMTALKITSESFLLYRMVKYMRGFSNQLRLAIEDTL